jgi:predicted dehydrogenase
MTRVGLIGAGPWALQTHLPALQSISSVEVSGIWAHRPGRAAAAAQSAQIQAFDDLDDLLEASDVVALAVTPAAQSALAIRAARAGRDLLLEKPIGDGAAQSRAVADAIRDSGRNAVVFASREWDSSRWPAMDELTGAAVGGALHYSWNSRSMLVPADTWREQGGPMLDVGPHIFPTLERIAGPIIGVDNLDETRTTAHIVFAHEGGGRSEIDLDLAVDVSYTRERIDVEGRVGTKAWSNDAAVDFLGGYRRMVAALERMRAGTATSSDRRAGSIDTQVRVALLLEQLESVR